MNRPVQLGAIITLITSIGSFLTPARAIATEKSATQNFATVAAGSARWDYARYAATAIQTLEQRYYTGSGTWNMCLPAICNQSNVDWGADSLTYTLYFAAKLGETNQADPIMTALTSTARRYLAGTSDWSDVPMWDAVADIREFQVTGDAVALVNAKDAFKLVDSLEAPYFAAGACPGIDYQRRHGGRNYLKTLETDSNYMKAALLLFEVTRQPYYLTRAEQKYAAVRRYFLSPRIPLYTLYVYDQGTYCVQRQRLYFASVNGNMIWDGATLARLTKNRTYLAQAISTARAISGRLADSTGVFADLQVENDVAEPLVEAMYLLATTDHQAFARAWLLRSASAAAASRTPLGTYGRYFDGPPPLAPVTAWQANGGLAVMIAAAKLDPHGTPAQPGFWRNAVFVGRSASLPPDRAGQVRISFTGRAIAIIGTLSRHCCSPGHAQITIDGRRILNRAGIWQGKFSTGTTLFQSVLFAWRWRTAGRHTITITPAVPDQSTDRTFFAMTGYYLVH